MAQNGTKWHKMAQNGLRMAQNGTKMATSVGCGRNIARVSSGRFAAVLPSDGPPAKGCESHRGRRENGKKSPEATFCDQNGALHYSLRWNWRRAGLVGVLGTEYWALNTGYRVLHHRNCAALVHGLQVAYRLPPIAKHSSNVYIVD